MDLSVSIAEFTLSTNEEPKDYYELVFYDSKETHQAVANNPEQDKHYHQLLELLEAPPEWNDGVIIHTNPNTRT